MAINFENQWSAGVVPGVSVTVPITVGSQADRVLLIWLNNYNAADYVTATTATVNGVSAGAKVASFDTNAVNIRGACWLVVAPPEGSYNVVVTAPQAAYHDVVVQLWSGVNQTTPSAASFAKGDGVFTSHTFNVAATSGQTIVDFFVSRDSSIVLTPGSGTAVGAPYIANPNVYARSSRSDGPVSSVTWTTSSSNGTGVHYTAVVLIASGGGGGSGATAITLTGPASGTTGVASSNFTVGANGTITGSHVVTPSDGGAGGTFTPASVTLTSSTTTATFTYTPASVGAKSITVVDAGGYTAPAAWTYTANSGGAGGVVSIAGIKNGTGTLQATVTIPNVVVIRRSDRVQLLALQNQTTSAAGVLTITNAALTAGTGVMVCGFTADGTVAGIWPVTVA